MDLKQCISDLSLGNTYETKHNMWQKYSKYLKHQIVHHVFLTRNIELAETIMKFFLDDYDKNSYNLMYTFVNLLCVVLASTHLPQYLKYIIQAKQIGDAFLYIDSNLLFEFTSECEEMAPVKNTLKNLDNICLHLSNNDSEVYRQMVKYYSENYTDDMVVKQWLKYKSPTFKLHIEERLGELSYD
jgi:hypothetical protein